MQGQLAVFVNSSDPFADCWPTFFSLFGKFAGDLAGLPVYLNTERADCRISGLDLTATKVWPRSEDERPSWSACLQRGLEAVREPFLLYLQEDYFLTGPVDTATIVAATELLQNNPEIGVVYLNRYGPQFTSSIPYAPGFVEIQPPARYLISTQAAVWRTSFLAANLFSWENGWMFEKFGSVRAAAARMKFLSVAPEAMARHPAIDYIYTGIIKGRWNPDCIALFQAQNLSVDFEKRGFYRDAGRMKSKTEVLLKLCGNPAGAMRSLMTLLR